MSRYSFDVIVIGGGHAGAEAAWASSRLGAKTLLVTMSRDTIAKMSCNPAIGGIAKGQIVREIDALGGLMGLAIDATGIQFRILNRSKGPAVQGPRAQADKYKYKDFIRGSLESASNLTIVEAVVTDISVRNGQVCGVVCLDGSRYSAAAAVLTAGTFLRGIMHIGDDRWPGGRLDEPAGNELSDSLRRLGIKLGRFKTGTPARLDGATVDYDRLEVQYGDDPARPFSFMSDGINRRQIPCWITWTNRQIHQLLADNLHRCPMYSGRITSVGPRYCPSIEGKIVRFSEKDRHQVFLEPEDEAVSTIYCNGISTSCPRDVQDQMLRLLPGTGRARVVHYGYAIEYDYSPATGLRENLESKAVGGLFLAGQINGTSGYEEAAGQGLVAGVNAARKLGGQSPLVLGRDQAYIGVLIDDLLTRDIDEPYRMFTSRAEYRLALRSDNADVRLTQIGRSVGLVDRHRWDHFVRKTGQMAALESYFKATMHCGVRLWDLLRQPQSDISGCVDADPGTAAPGYDAEVVEAVSICARYEGYLARQARQILQYRNLENIRLPVGFDYGRVAHLRFEAREKLSIIAPSTLGQANRVGGVTPADIAVIQVCLRKSGSV